MRPNLATLMLFFAFLGCPSPAPAASAKVYPGVFDAKIVSVYDGDTLMVDLPSVPAVFGERISVRVYGIDTPEMTGREHAAAESAKALALTLCPVGSKARLENVRRDKYFRLLADVLCAEKNLAVEMLKAGFAKPYFGGKKQ